MRTFKDNAGREWSIGISIATVKRVREQLGVDLLDIDDGAIFKRLLTDPVLLVDTLFLLCQTQAKTKGVTDEEFGEAMAGDALEYATDAFLDALTDFFPNPRRGALKKAIARLRGLEMKAVEVITRRLDDPALDRLVEQAGKSLPLAPASSD